MKVPDSCRSWGLVAFEFPRVSKESATWFTAPRDPCVFPPWNHQVMSDVDYRASRSVRVPAITRNTWRKENSHFSSTIYNIIIYTYTESPLLWVYAGCRIYGYRFSTVLVMQLPLVQDLISRPPRIEGKWNGCCPGPLENYVGAIYT